MNTETVKKTRSRWTAKNMTMTALMTALLSVSSYIVIPLPFTAASITAQTMVVNLIGMILGPVETAAVFAVWILLGLAGAPVFSGGASGPAKLFGPTGGYIFGFMAAAVLISLFSRKVKDLRKTTVFLIAVGIPVIYLFGAGWMKLVTVQPWPAVVVQSVLPFIPLDIVKCFAAAALAKALRAALR